MDANVASKSTFLRLPLTCLKSVVRSLMLVTMWGTSLLSSFFSCAELTARSLVVRSIDDKLLLICFPFRSELAETSNESACAHPFDWF